MVTSPIVNPPTQVASNVIVPQFDKTSLRGNYKFQITNPQLPLVVFVIDDSYVEFEGCNVCRLPYVAYTDGRFNILDGGAITKRSCQFDFDDRYISVLRRLNRFRRDNTNVVFLTDDKPVATLAVKVDQTVDTKEFIGTYNTELSGLRAVVKSNTITL